MSPRAIGHYAIRTQDLDASERFYAQVMGFHAGYRPPFDFPGRWLYAPGAAEAFGIVHLIGPDSGEPSSAMDYSGGHGTDTRTGTGPLDHIAFMGGNWDEMRIRLQRLGVAFQERTVPDLGLRQMFVTDPSGVRLELNFPAERRGAPTLTPAGGERQGCRPRDAQPNAPDVLHATREAPRACEGETLP